MQKLKIIDSHCHPQFSKYDEDRYKVIERSLDAGVGIIVVGTDFESSREAVEIAQKYDNVWATVGIHPNDTDDDFDIEPYKILLDEEKVVAIGEVGLDYFRTPDEQGRENQRKVLRQWLKLAEEDSTPMVFHCRDSYDDVLEAVSEFGNIRGVIHSFTSDIELANYFIQRGLYIGLNGIVTFSQEYDNLVENIPLESLLVETDSPFLSPHPHRGERNEPLRVSIISDYIARKKGMSVEELNKITLQNTKQLFNL